MRRGTAVGTVLLVVLSAAPAAAEDYVLWSRDRATGKIEKQHTTWSPERCLALKAQVESVSARYYDYACVKKGLDPKAEVARWR